MPQAIAYVQHKRRIPEMLELLAIRVNFRDQVVIEVDLDVIAIRREYGFGEANRRVSPGPMKCRLQYAFFRWVALRLVESRRRLWFAEDVGHTVIADAVARSEIRVR